MRFFLYALAALVLAGFAFVGLSSYAYRTPLATADVAITIPPRTGAWGTLTLLHEAGVAPRPLLTALMAEPLLTGDLPPVIAEGSVFPDTVHFARGEARAAVLARMQKQQQEVLAAAWANRAPNLPISTPEEALVLASIVEKETGVADERALVAGVFTNRLRLGMPLQTDPAVAYGVVVASGGAAMERALTTADLRRDTPYNTYTRKGLPPTPICNPGRKAIEATLNPATTDALYFVATGTGGHRFAATLAEHNRNVAEYRRALAKGN